jgi:hypothetical protein
MYPFRQACGWSVVVISLISGSSVALLVANTRKEVRNPAVVARVSRLYVVYGSHLAHFL